MLWFWAQSSLHPPMPTFNPELISLLKEWSQGDPVEVASPSLGDWKVGSDLRTSDLGVGSTWF